MTTRNLLFVENPGACSPANYQNTMSFCESLTDQAYVYLLDPTNHRMHDTAGGVRVLSRDLSDLPNFGSLDAVVAVGDPHLLAMLRKQYPDTPLYLLMEQANSEAMILCHKYSADQLLGGLADKAAQLFGYRTESVPMNGRITHLAS